MSDLMTALNHPAEAYKRPNRLVSWGFVGMTVLTLAVLYPLLARRVNGWEGAALSGRAALTLLAGCASYLVQCVGFWLICRAFGSTRRLMEHLYAWGLSFPPTLLCAVSAALAESFFFVFWGNDWLAMLLSVVLTGALIWKIILFTVYLREFADLKGRKFGWAFACGGGFTALMVFADIAAGLIAPVL